MVVTFGSCAAKRNSRGQGHVLIRNGQALGRVISTPACTRQIDFGPGVQVGKIAFDLARTFDRIDVGAQLDQIAGDETCREPEMPEQLNQQPGRVAAGARAGRERLLRRLDTRLHADDVADFLL